MRQLRGQCAGAAARDDKHGVVGKLRQRVGAVGLGTADGFDNLTARTKNDCQGIGYNCCGVKKKTLLRLLVGVRAAPADEIFFEGDVVAGGAAAAVS